MSSSNHDSDLTLVCLGHSGLPPISHLEYQARYASTIWSFLRDRHHRYPIPPQEAWPSGIRLPTSPLRSAADQQSNAKHVAEGPQDEVMEVSFMPVPDGSDGRLTYRRLSAITLLRPSPLRIVVSLPRFFAVDHAVIHTRLSTMQSTLLSVSSRCTNRHPFLSNRQLYIHLHSIILFYSSTPRNGAKSL